MRHADFIAWAMTTPWAMRPDALMAHASTLKLIAQGGRLELAASVQTPAIHAGDDATTHHRGIGAARGRPAVARAGSIAVVPLRGTIMPRANMLEMCGGGTSVETFTTAFREAMADETVSQILIDIDSPGGAVYGVGELADEVRAACSTKPVVAISDHVAASAAYWIGCAATEFYCTPGGEVGSIGVWQAHEDWSAAMAEEGVKVTLISAGKYKTEGNPYGPLDDDAQGFMQGRVNDYYGAFTKAVAKGRSVGIDAVRNGMGQGRVLGADAALAENMINGVATFDEVVKRMQRSAKAAKPGRNARQAAANELQLLGA